MSGNPDSLPADDPRAAPEPVASLDLDRPAFIEASAGTGKTYAIEHLVLRRLLERPRHRLPSLLVVTFTDKATQELRERIRQRLQLAFDALPEGDAHRALLAQALNDFPHASISTIHGFCQGVLRRYAYFAGLPLQREMKEGKGLFNDALQRLRRRWEGLAPAELQNRESLLESCLGKKWKKELPRCAQSFRPGVDEWFPGRTLTQEQVEREAEPFLDAWKDLAAKLGPDYGFEGHSIQNAVNQSGVAKDNWKFVLTPLKKLLSALSRWNDPKVDSLQAFFKDALPTKSSKWFYLEGAQASRLLDSKRRDLTPEAWLDCLDSLDALRKGQEAWKLILAGAQRAVARETAEGILIEAEGLRRERGLFTFDDCIRETAEALRRCPPLVEGLREEFSAAIVDEFQDTDSLQWEIFRRIFLPEESSTEKSGEVLPLVCIGDPKQAIYGFRGGDFRAYREARLAFETLARRGEAQGYGLRSNFRSHPALLEKTNALFSQAPWFGGGDETPLGSGWHLPPTGETLSFTAALPGRIAKPGEPEQDFPRLVALVYPEADAQAGNKEPLAPVWRRSAYRALAARVQELLVQGNTPGQIALLARSHRELESVAHLLRRLRIPVRLAQRELFEEPEAWHWTALLDALARPGESAPLDLALCSRFFRADDDPLPAADASWEPPVWSRWQAWAEARDWPRLFQHLLRDTGLVVREAREPDGDRRVKNWRRLAAVSATIAESNRFDLPELARWWRQRLSGRDDEEDTGTQIPRTDPDRVVLMTLHASKGLEFPHVLVTGLSRPMQPGKVVKLPRAQGGFSYRLVSVEESEGEDPKSLLRAQEDEENRRLYYVALTRARESLTLICPAPAKKTENTPPLGGFVREAVLYLAGDLEIRRLPRPPELPDLPEPLFAPAANPEPASEPRREGSILAPLEDSSTAENPGAPIRPRLAFITSYSSLAHSAAQSGSLELSLQGKGVESKAPMGSFGPLETAERSNDWATPEGRVRREDPLPTDPGVFDPSREGVEGRAVVHVAKGLESGSAAATDAWALAAQRLPGGTETGNALHEFLENLDFAAIASLPVLADFVADPSIQALGLRLLQAHGIDAQFWPDAAALVHAALRRKQHTGAGTGFRLCDVREKRAEMEFLLACGPAEPGESGEPTGKAVSGRLPSLDPAESVSSSRIPEWTRREGYLWGYIDLVFRHEGRYYLLDWKSNRLPDYGPEALAEAMRASRYDWQMRLYAYALHRHLSAVVPEYSYDAHFGGALFCFLRGSGQAETGGMFYSRPAEAEFRESWIPWAERLLQGGGGAS